MFQIRRGTFETNSSSSHSIVVMKDIDKYAGVYTPEDYSKENGFHDGVYTIGNEDDLEFSRYPFKILHSFFDKVRYAIAVYSSKKDFVKYLTKIINIAKKHIPGFINIKFPYSWETRFYDKDGKEIPSWKVHYDKDTKTYFYYTDDGYEECHTNGEIHKEYKYGYIDHQSYGIFEDFLSDKNITLEDFLIHKRYIIIVDGDEYLTFMDYKESGMFPVDLIEFEFPKYEI